MFITADPAMDGANHYAYANCNPVMYNDPTGFNAATAEGLMHGGVYGFIAGVGLLILIKYDEITGGNLEENVEQYFDNMFDMIAHPKKILTNNPTVVTIAAISIPIIISIKQLIATEKKQNGRKTKTKKQQKAARANRISEQNRMNNNYNKNKSNGKLTSIITILEQILEKLDDAKDLKDRFYENTEEMKNLREKAEKKMEELRRKGIQDTIGPYNNTNQINNEIKKQMDTIKNSKNIKNENQDQGSRSGPETPTETPVTQQPSTITPPKLG